jgi:microcystin-dependent protein
MQRINTLTKATDLFGVGKHGYKPGNPATNDPATTMSADALNSIQEEIARVIESSGVALDPASFTQLLTAIQALTTNRNISGQVRSLTPLGGALIREWADTVAATTGNIEFGISYNCAVDPVSGVWAGRDVVDICWLERWSDIGGQKEFWYAPSDVAGAAPVWQKVFALDMVGGGMYLAQEAGHISFFARSTAAAGYLKCNGAAVSRTAYSNLFSAIGTRFGVGDGSTTFNLPDLRGEFIRGFDDGRGVDTGRVLGSWQAADNAPHNHGITDPGHIHAVGRVAGGNGGLQFSGGTGMADIYPNTGAAATGISIAAQGTEGRPRNVALLAFIKY